MEILAFAAPISTLQLWLVLRDQITRTSILLTDQNINPQRWLACNTSIINASTILSDLEAGDYSLWLHLAEASNNNQVFIWPVFSV